MSINLLKQPDIHVVSHLDLPSVKEERCRNGAYVHVISGLSEPILQVEFVFEAGKYYEEKRELAQLTTEMLFEGSGGRSGPDILDELDGYGAYIDSSVGNEKITVTIYSTCRALSEVMNLFRTIFFEPNWEADSLKRLRSTFKQQFLVESEKVAVLARRKFIAELYKGHPYGSISEAEDFDRVDLDDCKRFYEDFILNGYLEVFVSGHVTKANLQAIKSLAGEFNATDDEPSSSNQIPFSPRGKRIEVQKDGAVQMGLRMGYAGIKRDHPDFIDLSFTTTLLGGYFGSRLMMNIREDKGYTYGIGAGLASYKRAGMMFIATEIGGNYVESTVSEINSELNRLIQEDVPGDELVLVKNYISGSLARALDGQFSIMESYKNAHFNGLDLSYYQDVLDRLQSINTNTVKEIAESYLKPEIMTVVLCGDFK